MNYGDFKTLVAGYLHRSDLTSSIPGFIELGRIRATDRLRVVEMESKATVIVTSDEGPLDEDLVSIRSVVASGAELKQVPVGQVTAVEGDVYAVYGGAIVAAGQSSVDVYGYFRPDTLLGTADATTRTLLSYYPSIWLQATLAEAYRYLNDTENEGKALDRLEAEVTAANTRSANSRYGSGPAVVSDVTSLQSMARL